MSPADWPDILWKLLGWIGISCFFARFLVQWIASERARSSVTPRVFWWISVAGALLMIAYSLHRGEPIFLAGYLVTLAIYVRNLWISHRPGDVWGPVPVVLLALLAWLVLVTIGVDSLRPGYGDSRLWLGIGVSGQTLWSSRFIVQWYLSERVGRSHFPEAFWWISLAGNALLLTYAVYVGDLIWIAGLCLGPLVQIRNLMIIHRSDA
jgi:lipid-A-disaccharide synthase-like uncharacterized protein